jgi:hypothetical protein
LTRAARHLERAAECLRLADASVQDDLKVGYFHLAKNYAELAEREQQIAATLERISTADARAAKQPPKE